MTWQRIVPVATALVVLLVLQALAPGLASGWRIGIAMAVYVVGQLVLGSSRKEGP